VLTEGFWDHDSSSTDYQIRTGAAPSGQRVAPVHAAVVPYGEKGKLVFFHDDFICVYDLSKTNDTQGLRAVNLSEVGPGDWPRIFCAGHALLPNGDLLIAGGDWGSRSARSFRAD
jgi:hypothetical protein